MSARNTVKQHERSGSSSDDNSFVKNVTARMSGLLPASVTKWFGRSFSPNTNGSASIVESSDSSTEDEAPEDKVNLQPVAKKMRFTSPSTSNDYIPKTTSTTDTEPTESFSVVKTSIDRSSFRPETNFVSTPLSSPNEETVSKPNTSEYNLQNSYSSIGYKSIIRKRKSLFDIRKDKEPYIKPPPPSTVADVTEPHIKRSLLGSPFYEGKTRYGGAAGFCTPNISHRNTNLVDKSTNNDCISISKSTMQVMDLLENYSSPLREAKRISEYVTSNDNSYSNIAHKTEELHVPSVAKILRLKQSSRLMNTTAAIRQIIASNSSSVSFTPYPGSSTVCNNPKDAPEKLTTKIKLNISRVNRQNKTVDVSDKPVYLRNTVLLLDHNNLPKFNPDFTNIATVETLTASNDHTNVSPVNSTPISTTNLMKQDHTVTANVTPISTTKLMKKDHTIKVTPICTINLMKKVNLTINAPSISTRDLTKQDNAITVNAASIPTTNLIQDEAHINNETEIANKPPIEINNTYKFSSPDIIVETIENSTSPIPNYTFGSPKRQIEEQSKEKEAKEKNTIKNMEIWKCNDCWVSNEDYSENCVCCGAGKPTSGAIKAKQGSAACPSASSQELLDKCNDGEKQYDGSVTQPIVTSEWKCQTCWVNNNVDVDKCVCCDSKKHQEVTSVIKARSNSIGSGWICDACRLENNSSADKCTACGGSKPASAGNQTKGQIGLISSNPTFKNIMLSQSDKWECINCMVRNDKDKSRCVCCDTEKSGKITESEKAKNFNFGTLQNTTFKFGIDPNQNIAEKMAVSLSVPQLEMPVKQLETNNNVSEPTIFTFGIPKPKNNNITVKQTIAEEAPKQTFQFGVSKPIVSSPPTAAALFSSPTDAGSKCNTTTLTSISETDENVQEVPNIEQPNATEPNNPQKPVGFFEKTFNNSSLATTAPALITFGQTEAIANTQAVPIVVPATVDAKVPESTFQFPLSGNSGLPMFSPVITAPSISSAPYSIMAEPSSTSISYFQKKETAPTSSMPLFTKTDVVPSSFNKEETMTTGAPVFSFGSNIQKKEPEELTYYNFGSTSEVPPVFNMQSSNTVSILSGNSLTSGNTATSNTTTGGNGLATINSITSVGNSLSSNPLASGLMGGPAKKDNIMWPSNNELGAINMTSGNSLEQGITNLPLIQSGNPFSPQPKKKNTWSLNQNNSLASHILPSGNNVYPANNSIGTAPGTMFDAPEKKDNMWSMSDNNSNNMFAPNAGTNSLPKPAAFSYDSSMQFNSNNVTPAPTFGSPTQTQAAQNIFGMSIQVNNNQPAMFSSNLQNQTPPVLFGAQAVNNTVSSVGMFGAPSGGSTFGTHIPSVPTFEAAPLNPVTPTFNFGAQQTSGVFGFGQQQAQSQGGVYKFGAQTATPPQQHFNIGTAGGPTNALGRPVSRPRRRAIRRGTVQ